MELIKFKRSIDNACQARGEGTDRSYRFSSANSFLPQKRSDKESRRYEIRDISRYNSPCQGNGHINRNGGTSLLCKTIMHSVGNYDAPFSHIMFIHYLVLSFFIFRCFCKQVSSVCLQRPIHKPPLYNIDVATYIKFVFTKNRHKST